MQDSFMLICAYHLLLFTNYMPDVNKQYWAGWSYITFVAAMLSYNFYGFFKMMFCDCYRVYRKKKYQRKLDKQQVLTKITHELRHKEMREY